MKVLYVTSELYPLVPTRCQGDVSGILPLALSREGVDVRVLMPAYPGALKKLRRKGKPIELGNPLGLGESRLIPGWLPQGDIKVWLLDCPRRFDREGGPYHDSSGHWWPDNFHRFALLSKVAALLAEVGGLLGWQPDILHANDWQTGLAPAYLALGGNRQCGTVFTVGNINDHGLCDAEYLHAFGLPPSALHINGLEFHGHISFLKAALYHSGKIITSSPSYAREIQLQSHGGGMYGVCSLRGGDLFGILNGLDDKEWNPAHDPHIPHSYDEEHPEGKLRNKLDLQREFRLEPNPDIPLLALVSSFGTHEGTDLVVEAISGLISAGAQLLVLGHGDKSIEHSLVMVAQAYPRQVAVRLEHNRDLHHRILAGCDLLLVPARFDPCAVKQLQGMCYGCLPVVRKTGGLGDTVIDCIHEEKGTGFVFSEPTGGDLMLAISRGINMFRNRQSWRQHQAHAMSLDFGWQWTAKRHLEIYQRAQLS